MKPRDWLHIFDLGLKPPSRVVEMCSGEGVKDTAPQRGQAVAEIAKKTNKRIELKTNKKELRL